MIWKLFPRNWGLFCKHPIATGGFPTEGANDVELWGSPLCWPQWVAECVAGHLRHHGVHVTSLHRPIKHANGFVVLSLHYNDVIMNAMASQITSLTIVYSSVYSGAKKTSKLRVTGFCEGNSPLTGEFPAQRGRNAENVSIWWRHHDNILMGSREPCTIEWLPRCQWINSGAPFSNFNSSRDK